LAPWRSGYAAACKAVYTGSIPVGAFCCGKRKLACWSDLSGRASRFPNPVEDPMKTVRVIYHHESDGWWAESPDVDGWSAAGKTYAEVVKLAEEGIAFALGHAPSLEHHVPAGENVPA
jgi:predicted RNase H-like HicB family nuclease